MALTREEKARSGPRGKKDPDSWEYAYQTLAHLKNMFAAKEASEDRFRRVLEEAEEAEIYNRLPDEDDPFGDMDTMLKETLGAAKDEAISQKARQYSGDELGEHGTNQHDTGGGVDSNKLPSGKGGTDPDYLAARIARDHPDVHERMKAGEFRSVRQAAIEAGIIEDIRTKQIRETDSPEKMEAKIRHVYGDDTADQLFGSGKGNSAAGEGTEDDPPEKITDRDGAPSGMELAGPLKTKDPGSEEYAFQLAGLLEMYVEGFRARLEDWEEATEKARRVGIHEALGYDTFPEMVDDIAGALPDGLKDSLRASATGRELEPFDPPPAKDIDPERAAIYLNNLYSAYGDGEHALSAVPGHVKKILREGLWQRRFCDPTGETVTFDSFQDFATAPPPEGLGADLDTLVALCEHDPEALELLRQHEIT